MAGTDFATIIGALGNLTKADLIALLEKRGAYVLTDAEDSRTISTGNCIYLIFNGRLFHYDAADATTAHDGVTCCVSFDGKRFKADGFGGGLLRIFSIVARTLTAPPGSPTVGQQWIVATGGTGAWAGKDGYIASWTARQWVFTVPTTYDLAMVAAESQYYNFGVSNTWVAGLPAYVLGTNSISPSAIKYARFGLTVVNQTTNAPPGSPADGDAYIIGGSPTGAWAGNARKIAIYETSGWVIYSPKTGDKAYDIATGSDLTYNSGTATWGVKTGYAALAASSKTGKVANTGTYQFTATAPPTGNTMSIQSLSYSAKKAAAFLEVTFEIDAFAVDLTNNTGANANTTVTGNLAVGIFIDGAASATDWQHIGAAQTETFNPIVNGASVTAYGGFRPATFRIQAPNDTSAHTYAFRIGITSNSPSNWAKTVNVLGVRMIIRELA